MRHPNRLAAPSTTTTTRITHFSRLFIFALQVLAISHGIFCLPILPPTCITYPTTLVVMFNSFLIFAGNFSPHGFLLTFFSSFGFLACLLMISQSPHCILQICFIGLERATNSNIYPAQPLKLPCTFLPILIQNLVGLETGTFQALFSTPLKTLSVHSQTVFICFQNCNFNFCKTSSRPLCLQNNPH